MCKSERPFMCCLDLVSEAAYNEKVQKSALTRDILKGECKKRVRKEKAQVRII